jgi:protein SMG6
VRHTLRCTDDSLTASHPFESSRESILPLFDSVLQSQRSLPDATAMDLFVRLHGMLFTKIALDDFPAVMSRYMERLEEDARLDGVSRTATVSQVDWLLMAAVNLAAVLQYGAEDGIIRKAFAQEGVARKKAAGGDVEGEGAVEDDQNAVSLESIDSSSAVITPTYAHALELAFSVFDFVLEHPLRVQGVHSVLNPYITVFLTFLATIFRQRSVGSPLLPFIPWRKLVLFVNASTIAAELREEPRLISGITLPEDWAMRGMEWIGRRVYERGVWKTKSNSRSSSGPVQPRTGERFSCEMDVLEADYDGLLDVTEGVVDEVDGADTTDGPVAVNARRWKRVGWAAGVMVKHIDGLSLLDGQMVIDGSLERQLNSIEREKEEEAAHVRKAEELKRQRMIEADTEAIREDIDSGGSEEDNDAELAILKVDDKDTLSDMQERRRHLQSLLPAAETAALTHTGTKKASKRSLNIVQGHTMLVFDTNVLLSSLSVFARVVEGGLWSVIVPLPGQSCSEPTLPTPLTGVFYAIHRSQELTIT